jgi:hypothetical protein
MIDVTGETLGDETLGDVCVEPNGEDVRVQLPGPARPIGSLESRSPPAGIAWTQTPGPVAPRHRPFLRFALDFAVAVRDLVHARPAACRLIN